ANALTSLSETQQQSTEMIATAMTEMASSTGHVAESAKETAHNTQDADQQSQYTQQLIQSTVVNIEGLATELSTAGQAVSHLDNDINSIAKVLNVIGDIAEQTNLLALNAAIEAARAGEQGRGFAVVADEVRSLAGRTQNSTKEIREMIDNLQQSSRHALTAMDTCASTSMSTVEQSRQASESLSQIVQALESITTMSHQIASAADQQKHVGDDIAERINLIDDSGRQLSTVITQSHASTTTLSALSQALEDAISQFTILSAPRR
ncbi:chemotaxis protein, partial [Photobacterium aphoticum]